MRGGHSLVEGVALFGLLQSTGHQHRHDQTVDGDNTRHDDGYNTLHDELRPHHGHGGYACAGLGRAVRRTQRCNKKQLIRRLQQRHDGEDSAATVATKTLRAVTNTMMCKWESKRTVVYAVLVADTALLLSFTLL